MPRSTRRSNASRRLNCFGLCALLSLFLSAALSAQTTGAQHLAFAGLRSVAQKGQINGVQSDASGNLYLLIDQGDGVRLLKTDNAATTILAQTLLGATGDSGVALALDVSGNVYLTGTTNSATLTGTSGAAIPARTGTSTNSFVAELDSNLNLLWLSFTGGSRIASSAIALTQDAVFVTGITYATNLPVTATAIQQSPALGSSQNGFVERFSTSGNSLVYATYLTGASGDTTPAALAADPNDNAYIAGFTTATGFPTIAALVPAILSNPSGFLSKLDPAGDEIIASTFIPGAGLTSLVFDASTQTLLASGSIALGQFPVATVASPLIPTTYQVLLRLPLSLGTVNNSTLIAPGTQSNVAAGVAGTAWIDGTLSQPLLPLEPLASIGNGFAARVNSTAAIDQTARFGGLPNGNPSFASLPAVITAIAVDPTGEAVIAGAIQPTASSSLLATQTYDLPLFNTPTTALPSTITDAELTATTCNGSLCAGSAAYLAKLTPTAGTSLTFSTGELPWLTLRNLGSTEADNLTLTASGATLNSNCPTTLYGGAECDLLLSGSSAGTITAATSNSGSETITFPAFAAPSSTIVLSPKELDFGIQTSTSAAATRTITVTNLGTASQTFTSAIDASARSPASPFTETASDCPIAGTTQIKLLAAGATCHITIAFNAYSASASDGTLQADWSIGAATIALTGYSQAAALSLSATGIDFGTQYSNGIHLPRYLYLSNSSASPIAHTAVTLPATSPFTVTDNCPATLLPASVCQIQINYLAAATTSNDAVTLALDQGLSALITGQTLPPVTAGGATANPNLAVTPITVSFSSAVVVTGVSPTTQTVAVTNSGASAFPLTLAIAGDFSYVTSCSATLAAGATCAVALTFVPSQPGVRQGTLSIAAGAGTSPIIVALSGTATAILPANNGGLDFGSVPVGEPAVQWYQIAQPLSTLSVTTSGPFTAVIVQNAGYGPGSPPVSAYATSVTAACPNCYLGLSFTPTATGPQTGAVTLTSAAQGTPYTLALSGIGTAVTGLILTPTTQDFGVIPLGSTSGSFTFTLTNQLASASAATLASSVSGDFTILPGSSAQSCGTTLAYTASCTLQLAFTPTAIGASSGTLTLAAGSSTATATLTGTAVAAAAVTINPLALTFTDGAGAASTQQTLTLTNNGSGTVQIGATSLGTSSFAAATNCATLLAGASCTITVTFAPGSATVADTLSIPVTTTGAGAASTTGTVALSGNYTASAAGLTISPAIANYGTANVDTQGITQQFTVSNTTAKAFALNLDLPRQYALVGAPCTTLAPSASCSFSAQFAPLTNGTIPGSIIAVATPSDGSATLTSIAYVEGYGTGQGSLTLSGGLIVSGVFNFGQVASGQTASQTFTLTNASSGGSSAITVRRVTSNPPFLSTTSCGSELEPGQSCAVIVTYAPTNQVASGTDSPPATSDAGTLTIESDALSSPAILNLTGQAGPVTAANPGSSATLATFTLSQGSLTFASTLVGDATAAQTLTLTNTGTQPMQVASITATADFSIAQSGCATLTAAASCTISVESTPQTAGTHLAALAIASNAATSLEFISLISTATPSPLTFSPGALTFTSLPVGTSATLPIQVTNTGTTPITFTSVAATGDYTLAGSCPAAGAALAAGASCTGQITFKPLATGARGGTLTFTTSASTQPLTVALSGIGTIVQLLVSPTSLSFGNVAVGVPSNLQLTLTNNGTVALTGIALTIGGDYIVSSPCGATTLAPAASCAVEITFTPSAAGARNATLSIASSDPASPMMVPLTGTGIAANGGFTLTVATATASAQSGKPAIYDLAISPTGGFVGTVALTCAPIGTVQYVSCSILPPSVALSGSAQASVVTINTVTSIAAGSVPARPGLWVRDTFFCLLAPCTWLVLRDRRTLRKHRLLLAAMFFCAATLFASGCGSSQDFSLRYASAGSYQFVITGASTTGVPAMQSVTLTLQVTPR